MTGNGGEDIVTNYSDCTGAESVDRMRKKRTHFKALMCHLYGKRPVGYLGHRWMENIERDDQDLKFEGTWTERTVERRGWRGIVIIKTNNKNNNNKNKRIFLIIFLELL